MTLELVRRADDPEHLHAQLDVPGVFLADPPSHAEQEVVGGEAVATQRVAEGVLGPEAQLQPPVGVSVGLKEVRFLIRRHNVMTAYGHSGIGGV